MGYYASAFRMSPPDLCKTEGVVYIEWNIPNYKSLLEDQPSRIFESPLFQMGGDTWSIRAWSKSKSVWIALHKDKKQSRSNSIHRSLSCEITLLINKDEMCGGCRKTCIFNKKQYSVFGFIATKENLSKRMTSDNLRVLCIVFPEVQVWPSEGISESLSRVAENQITSDEGIGILSSHMRDLFLNGENCDFVLKVKGRNFQVHKTILAARSPVLSAMLQHDMAEKNSGTTNIDDCEPEVFEQFLLYLYSGRVEELSWSNATHLYTLGDKYDMPHLRKECLQFMKGNLSVEAFCDAIALAVKHNESTLVKCAEAFFVKNAKNILVTNKWQLFLTENPIICNELFLKCYK